MLLARGGEEAGPGATQTQQNLSLLQNKWGSLNGKMDDRRVRRPHWKTVFTLMLIAIPLFFCRIIIVTEVLTYIYSVIYYLTGKAG